MPLSSGSAYVGAWINYSKGNVIGATLTIPSQYGSVLIAVIVLLVGWTGTHFWGLVCFVLHRLRSTPRAKDGLYYQQQVLLRSGMAATGILYRLLELGFAWRSNTQGSFRRTIPLSFAALINIAMFIAAGIFSSRVTSTNNEVLARGKCGFLKGALDGKPMQEWLQEDRDIGDVMYSAAYSSYREENSYTRSCYGNHLERETALCNVYTVPFIASSRNNDALCPFSEIACSAPAISFDTGMMDSNDHFGINGRPSDRVQMRKTMSCAPIRIDNYSANWTSEVKPGLELQFEHLLPNDAYKYYNLGSSLFGGVPSSEFTWAISNATAEVQNRPYQLGSATFFPQFLEMSAFDPISELNRSDADVTLLFLTNRVAYTGEVKDPWFKATSQGNTSWGFENVYFPDETVSGIGCTEQFQFCNGEKCSPMNGFFALDPENPPDIGFNKLQSATYQLMLTYAGFMQLNNMLQFLRNEVLLASQLVYGSGLISSPVEATHWHSEMENLHNVSLAGMQAHAVYHAAPGNVQIKPRMSLHDVIVPETSPEQLVLCNNQKFRSTAYASFNLLGVCLILILSFLIIMLNTVLPTVVGWIQGKGNKREWNIARLAWIEDDVLQLQRMAFEGRGIGPWKGRADNVPVMESYGLKFQRKQFAEDGEQVQLSDVCEPLNQW